MAWYCAERREISQERINGRRKRACALYLDIQLFEPACLVYLLSDVRPVVELGDYLNQEGVFNPFLV